MPEVIRKIKSRQVAPVQVQVSVPGKAKPVQRVTTTPAQHAAKVVVAKTPVSKAGAALPTAAPSATAGTGWVIEIGSQAMGADQATGRVKYVPFTDPSVIRFARQQDATVMASVLFSHHLPTGLQITEHTWS